MTGIVRGEHEANPHPPFSHPAGRVAGFGIAAAVRRGRWLDQMLSVVSLFGLSVPGLALGPVLILVFSILLGWLPVSGANAGATR